MTAALFTVDTELSPALHQRGSSPMENLRIAVLGEVSDGTWGIGYQVDRLNAHRVKGVFFVEALCAYAFGNDILKRMIDPILSGGHEVQLHLHTEWLAWINRDLVGDRRGANMADFDFADQRRLLELGIESLITAGAPAPTAFRAGNYGANNDTLQALTAVGLDYDSSYSYPYLSDTCGIEVGWPLHDPIELDGVIEVPITFFEDYPGHMRPLQLCAASAAELRWVMSQSIGQARETVVVVSHSFELLNTKRSRANKMLLRRFEDVCDTLQTAGSSSMNFRDLSHRLSPRPSSGAALLKSNPMRTASRMVQQLIGGLR